MEEVFSSQNPTGEQFDEVNQIHLELADRLTSEEARSRVADAVQMFLLEEQREVWRRRRDRMLHQLGVIEYNLDYDLRVRGIAS